LFIRFALFVKSTIDFIYWFLWSPYSDLPILINRFLPDSRVNTF